MLFNELLPVEYRFVNEQMPKKRQAVINDLAERYPDDRRRADRRQAQGRRFPLGDPPRVSPSRHVRRARAAEQGGDPTSTRSVPTNWRPRFQRGALTPDERRDSLVEIWKQATEEVGRAMEALPGRQPDRHDPVVGCHR